MHNMAMSKRSHSSRTSPKIRLDISITSVSAFSFTPITYATPVWCPPQKEQLGEFPIRN
jgi:hypothetical protein